MKNVKIKVLTKKPSIRIDANWFPYKDIVNKVEFDKIVDVFKDII